MKRNCTRQWSTCIWPIERKVGRSLAQGAAAFAHRLIV